MSERPILFSAPMVRAILDGRKTQTRRVVTHSCIAGLGEPHCYGWSDSEGWCFGETEYPDEGTIGIDCPYGQPGDTLWVRETFYCDHYDYPRGDRDEMLRLMEYRATHDCLAWEAGCPCDDGESRSAWRPSIHMPRWASRLSLRVTDVRVERVRDISEEDGRAEGVTLPTEWHVGRDPTYRHHFANLWDTINGKRPGCSWAANPWVWVVGFAIG